MNAEDYSRAVSVSLELLQARAGWGRRGGTPRLRGDIQRARDTHRSRIVETVLDVDQTPLSVSFYSGVGGAESMGRWWLGREEERQAGEHDAISER